MNGLVSKQRSRVMPQRKDSGCDEDGRIIASFQKSAMERECVRTKSWKGEPYIDVRVYYDAGNVDYRPTTKGICLRLDLLADLLSALGAVENTSPCEGLD